MSRPREHYDETSQIPTVRIEGKTYVPLKGLQYYWNCDHGQVVDFLNDGLPVSYFGGVPYFCMPDCEYWWRHYYELYPLKYQNIKDKSIKKEKNMLKRSISNVQCRHCGSDNTRQYNITNARLDPKGTGSCHADFRCDDCHRNFRVLLNFKYELTKISH
jgi:hypothetical protein